MFDCVMELVTIVVITLVLTFIFGLPGLIIGDIIAARDIIHMIRNVLKYGKVLFVEESE